MTGGQRLANVSSRSHLARFPSGSGSRVETFTAPSRGGSMDYPSALSTFRTSTLPPPTLTVADRQSIIQAVNTSQSVAVDKPLFEGEWYMNDNPTVFPRFRFISGPDANNVYEISFGSGYYAKPITPKMMIAVNPTGKYIMFYSPQANIMYGGANFRVRKATTMAQTEIDAKKSQWLTEIKNAIFELKPACPPLDQCMPTTSCLNGKCLPPPVNCTRSTTLWGPWSNGPCDSTTCGLAEKTTTRTRKVVTEQKYGGTCVPSATHEEIKVCPATATCVSTAVDCVLDTEWEDWSGANSNGVCPTTCGSDAATITRQKKVKTPKQGTGLDCVWGDTDKETNVCAATAACTTPVDCVLDTTWGPWSGIDPTGCPTKCGSAAVTITRQKNIKTPKQGTGTDCEFGDTDKETKTCAATAECLLPEEESDNTVFIVGGVVVGAIVLLLIIFIVMRSRGGSSSGVEYVNYGNDDPFPQHS